MRFEQEVNAIVSVHNCIPSRGKKKFFFLSFHVFFFFWEKIISCVREHNLFNFLSQEGENSHLRTSLSSLPRFVSFKNGSWLVPGQKD